MCKLLRVDGVKVLCAHASHTHIWIYCICIYLHCACFFLSLLSGVWLVKISRNAKIRLMEYYFTYFIGTAIQQQPTLSSQKGMYWTRWKTEATPKADALERARGRCRHQGAASQGLSTLSAPRLKRCCGTGLGETSIAISRLSKQKKERSFTLPTLRGCNISNIVTRSNILNRDFCWLLLKANGNLTPLFHASL